MLYLNLNAGHVPAGETVALTADASITSLGEVKVGRRTYQARRTIETTSGRLHLYLVDARGNGFIIDADGTATSRNTGKPITAGGVPVTFRRDGDRLVTA